MLGCKERGALPTVTAKTVQDCSLLKNQTPGAGAGAGPAQQPAHGASSRRTQPEGTLR